MSLDVKVPLVVYKDVFTNYLNKAHNLVSELEAQFNFGREPDDIAYHDFWASIDDPINLVVVDFNLLFLKIETIAQELNDMIGLRYMDYVGMVSSLDNYVCHATDSFSRITDSIWSFGDGQVYANKLGKLLEDGTFEIARMGLHGYVSKISSTFLEMNEYMLLDPGNTAAKELDGMSVSKVNDPEYLEYKRDVYFGPKIMEISSYIKDAQKEVENLITFLEMAKLALTLWLPESFKLVAYTSLVFNLSKKNESLANKAIGFSKGVTTTTLIAVSQANFWKQKILPDQTNRGQCLTEAILAGLSALTYPSQLASFIDESWELMIPKYGSK